MTPLTPVERCRRVQLTESDRVTHTQPFNGPLSETNRVSRYQKGKTNLDFTEARDSEWQWHQLGHMQVCTSLQTDNHTSTPPLSFLQTGCPSCHQTNSVKAVTAVCYYWLFFCRPRSEGWPHHGHSFSICLSSIILIDSSTGVLSISLCCPSRPCVVFLTCVHLALFLALSLSPGNCLVSSWCDHSMLCYHHPWLNDILQLLNAVAKIHHAMKSCLW